MNNHDNGYNVILENLQQCLSEVQVEKGVHYHNLTLFPLVGNEVVEPPYLLLEEAIGQKAAEVQEIHEAGSVPELLLINHADKPILLPEGEILVGAKQNRVINITLLVAAQPKTVIPVSCVEQGRWGYRSRTFEPKFFASPEIRHKKVRSVHRSMERSGRPISDQGEVWQEVAEHHACLQVHSPTGSFTDSFEARRDTLEQYRKHLQIPREASGMVLTRGERILGLDLFDSPRTFNKLSERLLDGYILEALRDNRDTEKPRRKRIREFIAQLPPLARIQGATVGIGVGIRLTSDTISGCGLWYSGKIRHLAVFSAN